jgi:hypothetical protein
MTKKMLSIRVIVISISVLIFLSFFSLSISGNTEKNVFSFKTGIINDYNLFLSGLRDPPDEEWNKTYGGDDYDYDIGYCVQQTDDNGFIIAGGSSPPGQAHYTLLVKTDSDGVEQWMRSNGDLPGYYANSVHQTSDGGYILTGIIYQNDSIYADVFLCKTDSNGIEEWTKTINLSTEDIGSCVRQTSDGGYILTGSSYVIEGYYPIDAYGFIIKTNSTGNIQWNKKCPSISFSYSVKQTTDEGYILTGGVTDSLSSENCDVLLIKTDDTGEFIWEKTFIESKYGYGLSVSQTSDEGYIVTGASQDNDIMDSEIFLIKTDSDGDDLWTKTYASDNYEIGNSVDQTNDGGYIIAASSNEFGVDNYGLIVKTDEQGDLLWDKLFGPSGSFYSVEQTNEGGYITVGQTEYYGPPKGNVWMVKLAPDYEYQPDLECYGHQDINLSDIFPGSTINGIHEIVNVGGEFSLLDWKIESFPDWGTWSFSPDNGNDLKTEDGPFKIHLEIKAPNEKNKTFNGIIKIINKHDSTDSCSIKITISTPRIKSIDLKPFYHRLYQQIPTLCKMFKTILLLIF